MEEDRDLEREEVEALSCLVVAALAAFVVFELGNKVEFWSWGTFYSL